MILREIEELKGFPQFIKWKRSYIVLNNFISGIPEPASVATETNKFVNLLKRAGVDQPDAEVMNKLLLHMAAQVGSPYALSYTTF